MFKLLILDVDGVLTDGTKRYDSEHNVLSKGFMCKDFTAIKRFSASGVKVVMISGDEWNRKMAEKRNIDFYCSRGDDLSLDKSRFIDILSDKYGISSEDMAFVGDDYFDLSMFKAVNYTFCPNDAPSIIKEEAKWICNRNGGEGVIVEIYDWCVRTRLVEDSSPEAVAELDKLEASSEEMS
jgi:3-deoxy-D-manno-octulosonate 8-phosphate phosphatase (KDO 8-P phosphatase)